MVIAVENFLAKYPKFNDENDAYRFYDESAERVLVDKLEFSELALSPTTENKKGPNGLFYHQLYVSRFGSSYTGYDELLLVHEMGTGKTCTAIGLAEKLRYEKNSWVKGAVVVTKGSGLLKNFINELLFVCTDGRYVPENYDALTELEKTIRVNKIVKKFYELKTYETFSKEIDGTSDSTLKIKYENKLLIFDEIHNVRQKIASVDGSKYKSSVDKSVDKSVDAYASFHRLCHLLTRRKILLMSGTPMKDDPSEIASVMNLLLPLDRQLPVGKNFNRDFIDQKTGKINPDSTSALVESLRGKTSYLRASTTFNVRKIFVSNNSDQVSDESLLQHEGSLNHFVTYDSEMSSFQSRNYAQAYFRDKGIDANLMEKNKSLKSVKSKSNLELELFGSDDDDDVEDLDELVESGKRSNVGGIYLSSQQASLLVYPDGSYGSKGFARYVMQVPDYGASVDSYILDKEFVKLLKPRGRDTPIDEIIENIRKYSCKYADIIERAVKYRKKTFVYCNSVTGSGAIVLCKLLELCGYKSTSTSKANNRSWRFSLISNKTMSENEIRKTLNRFNSDPDGTVVQLLVGSRVINEGYTLRNVNVVEVVTPHWNFSETSQAIARAWRTGSHDDKDSVLMVYLHVAIYDLKSGAGDNSNDDVESVDRLMYIKSEYKDVAIKSVERIIKETSFDCPLSKYQNSLGPEMDGQRECEYSSCEYECLGGPVGQGKDDSTYNAYYSDDGTFERLVSILRKRFLTENEIDVSLLREMPGENFREFEFDDSLTRIVSDSVTIRDRYGFVKFVRIKGNVLFLSTYPTFNVATDKFVDKISDKYLETNVPWDVLRQNIYDKNIGVVIKNIFDADSVASSKRMIANLDEFGQRLVLEICIYKKYFREPSGDADIVDALLSTYYKDFYGKLPDGKWYINLHAEKLGGAECYEESTNEWRVCDVLHDRPTIDFEKSPIGYYGLYNPQLDQFCIKDVRKQQVSDVRKKSVGRRCLDWESYKLVELATNVLKLDPDQVYPRKDFDIEETRGWLAKFSRGKLLGVIDESDEEAMKRFSYWSKSKRSIICEAIKKWFDENGFLVDDFTCGQQKKTRLDINK